MSSDKKDLTRIEDLGEYIHELSQDSDLEEGLPDLPTEETHFESTEFGAQDSSFDEVPEFNSEENNFQSEDVNFGTEENAFSSENAFTDENAFSEENTFAQEETPFNAEENSFPTEETPFESEASPFTEEPLNPAEEPTFTSQDSDELSFNTETPEPAPLEEMTPEEPLATEAPVEITPVEPIQTFKAPETFEDVKKFGESTSFTGMGAEGNPSFSVLLKNVRFIEDVNDILTLLKELNLMSDSEEQMKARLMRGHLLVPRISEYAAVFLAHKLRRFDIDIQVGLSDEIHPPKHQEAPETGLVSKFNLYQNQSHNFHFDDPKLELSQIIVAATPSLEGHQVIRYIGIASEHKMLEGHVVEDEDSEEIPRHYSELAQKLKAHALKAHANAVVGLNYQLTPMPSEFGVHSNKYRLSCTGNLVWVNKL